MHEHSLTGCQPVPLAHYLKALGVLRLVAEQADADARGRWGQDGFVLETRLSAAELEAFFLEEYAPTPIVGPWGARSGFFPGSSEKNARAALNAIEASDLTRLEELRNTIATVRHLLALLGIGEKDDVSGRKDELMEACRARLSDPALVWLDACYVLTRDGGKFPPILGTGGNEGSLSYMSNFSGQVVECVIERKHDRALASALWETPAAGVLSGQPPGQFLPGAVDGRGLMNPWDFVLCLEGTMLFASALARRSADVPGVLTAPFTVGPTRAGYGSAAAEKSRGEMWMPLWERPTRLTELSQLLREGRADLGRRRARNGVDFARAVSTLGVDRGLTGFQRYGFLERNGLSNFATPLDRIEVGWRPGVARLGEIDRWLDRFRRQAGSDTAPNSAGRALRELDEAIFALCRRDDEVRRRGLLVALGRCEQSMARSTRWAREARLDPVPPLSPQWLEDLATSPELRLAAAVASLHERYRDHKDRASGGRRRRWLRAHLTPVDVRYGKNGSWVAWREDGDRDVVWVEGDLQTSLQRILQRRMLAAEQNTDMYPDRGVIEADLGDVADFIEGRVDERTLADLLWGLSLLDWNAVTAAMAAAQAEPTKQTSHTARPLAPRTPANEPWPDAAYALLKLCFAGHELGPTDGATPVPIPQEPRIQRLAAAGRSVEASRAAVRRLRAAGLVPVVSTLHLDAPLMRRIAAALLFPLSRASIRTLVRSISMAPDAEPRALITPDEQGVVA
ncbi:type I-G CRISPR-associated protein Cas8g1/Csx17 [Haliangium sp.]|uniref:type I-G CRISPR-associated protein Cas8g1/Csx17 n=1 Tax=Haliangium sp. TaxID=2663208 RepID=UPI003D0BA993